MKAKLYLQRGVLAVFALLLTSIIALAQDRRVTGKVTGADGSAIPGASVAIKGTTIGTTTNATGEYAINVRSAKDILVISSVGYTNREITVGTQSAINVSLEDDVTGLEEVIVTGYASQAKKDITGAVSVVKAKDLTSNPVASFAGQLQGRAPGVVVGSSGEPGAPTAIRIRGIGSFGDNSPLLVIDGVQTSGPYQSAVNPDDVESIQVLKDASAGSIYGANGGNGVLIITTKRGKAGATRIDYDGYYGVQGVGRTMQDQILNPTELGQLLVNQYRISGQPLPSTFIYGSGATPVLPDFLVNKGGPYFRGDDNASSNLITRSNKAGTMWGEEIFQTAPIMNHNIGVSGGTDKSRFYFGLGYFNQDGIVKNTYFKRYSIRANSEFTIKKNITIGEQIAVSLTDNVGTPGGNQREGNPFITALRMPSIVPIFDEGGFYAGSAGVRANAVNPLQSLDFAKNNNYLGFNLLATVFADVKILKDLTFRTTANLTYFSGNSVGYEFKRIADTENNSNNAFGQRNDQGNSWRWTNLLTYTKKFDKHNVTAFVGYESSEGRGGYFAARRTNYFIDDVNFRDLNAGAGVQTNEGSRYTVGASSSYFGKLDYSFDDKYLFTATVRNDGNSVFGVNNKRGTFPAFSAGWRMSREDFMKDITFVDELKLRAGWGQAGNSRIPNTLFSTYGGGLGSTAYPITGGNNLTTGFAANSIGNPNLKWETITSLNIGFDASIAKGKFDVVFDYWTRESTDLLIPGQLPFEAGLKNAPFVNFGTMFNKGVDLGITYHGKAGKFKYDIAANFSTYRNEVTRLDDKNPFFAGADRIGNFAVTKAGAPISSFFGYKVIGIFQSADEGKRAPDQGGLSNLAGAFQYADINGDKVINDDDRTIIGSPHPDYTYGLDIKLFYGNFDFNVFFQGVQGNQIFNHTRYWIDFNSFQGNRSKRMLYESWNPASPSVNAKLPILSSSNDFSGQTASSYYLEDGSYLRCKTLQLGYNFAPAFIKKAGIEKLRLYFQSNNLFTLTSYTGLDPDIRQRFADDTGGGDRSMGIDAGQFPVARNFIFGLNLSF